MKPFSSSLTAHRRRSAVVFGTLLVTALAAVAGGGHAAAGATQSPGAAVPKTVLMDGAVLARVRQQGDAAVIHEARIEADKAMKETPVSVVTKSQTPPSGDKHDYMSLAPYFWPNPATKDHLPYIRKDGQHNPEASAVPDHENMFRMEDNVRALAVGYFLTGDEAYARQATLHLHVWFLDPATRMNPNLQYAQAVLGVNDGRGTGILDARGLTDVVDSLALLAGSSNWSAAEEAAMHAWFSQYFTWLTTSKNGNDEANAKNNHGSWDDVQTMAIALYLGKTEFVKNLAETAKTKRIALQIQADGQQPMEEARTKSFGYCVFNLTALMKLATMAEKVDVDLWNYKAESGGSIRVALNYLVPFTQDPKAWGHEDINGMSTDSMREPLLRAALHYNDASYEAVAMKLKSKSDVQQMLLAKAFTESQAAEAKGRGAK